MRISPLAGKPADPSTLVDVPRLITAYYTDVPDPSVASQRVAFGTSGHRGSSFDRAFNEWHILAISQAICLYRTQRMVVEVHLFNGEVVGGKPVRVDALQELWRQCSRRHRSAAS